MSEITAPPYPEIIPADNVSQHKGKCELGARGSARKKNIFSILDYDFGELSFNLYNF